MIYWGEGNFSLFIFRCMDIQVYTIQNCFYCSQVKELFRRANLAYKEVLVVPNDEPDLTSSMIKKEDFSNTYPQVGSFPHVIIDGESIGGIVDTAKLLVSRGLVSGKKA